MVIDVVSRLGFLADPEPDTGSLYGDLRALLAEVHAWLTLPRLRKIVPDLLAEAGRSPDLGAEFRERLAGPRRALGEAVLRRATARGELDPAADLECAVDVVLDVLGSAPYWRLAVGGADVDDAYLDQLTHVLTVGLLRHR